MRSVRLAAAAVAGAEPAVGEGARRRIRVALVFPHHHRPLHPELADLAIGQRLAVLARDADLRPADGAADAALPLEPWVAADGEPDRLRHAPADLDRQAGEGTELALPRPRHHVTTSVDPTQRGEILATDVRRVQQLHQYVDVRHDQARRSRAQRGM